MSFIKDLLEGFIWHLEAVTTDLKTRFKADIKASASMEARILFINKMRDSRQLEPGIDYTFDIIRSE